MELKHAGGGGPHHDGEEYGDRTLHRRLISAIPERLLS